MASRKDTILKAAQRTAKQAHAAASKRGYKSKTRVNIEPHRHCSVCWKPISLESDPAICGDDGCLSMYERREKSEQCLCGSMFTLVFDLYPLFEAAACACFAVLCAAFRMVSFLLAISPSPLYPRIPPPQATS
jgi:predicted nucleic acid-binding Zn ribbon protein